MNITSAAANAAFRLSTRTPADAAAVGRELGVPNAAPLAEMPGDLAWAALAGIATAYRNTPANIEHMNVLGDLADQCWRNHRRNY